MKTWFLPKLDGVRGCVAREGEEGRGARSDGGEKEGFERSVGFVPARCRDSCCWLWMTNGGLGLLRSCEAETEGRKRRRGVTIPETGRDDRSSPLADGPAEDGSAEPDPDA